MTEKYRSEILDLLFETDSELWLKTVLAFMQMLKDVMRADKVF